jgi:hypothetical protein
MNVSALDAPAGEFSLSDLITKQISDSFSNDDASTDSTQAEELTNAEPAKPAKGGEAKPDSAPVKESTVDDFLGEDSDEPEVAPDDEDIPDDVKNQGEKAIAKWGDLKKTTKEQAKELERVTRELAELKANANSKPAQDSPAEVEELRKALEDRERVIAAVSVVDSIEYKETVSAPAIRLENRARSLTQDDDLAESMVDAVFEADPKSRHTKLADVCDGLPDYTRTQLMRIADDVEIVMERRDELFANAQVAKQEIERNRLAQKGEESAKEKAARIEASNTVWKNIVKKLPFVANEDGEVLPEYKDVREKGLGGITDETSLGARAFAAYAVHLVPKMDTIINQQKSRISELESSIKAMKGAAPDMGNSGSDSKAHANETAAERVIRLMNS